MAGPLMVFILVSSVAAVPSTGPRSHDRAADCGCQYLVRPVVRGCARPDPPAGRVSRTPRGTVVPSTGWGAALRPRPRRTHAHRCPQLDACRTDPTYPRADAGARDRFDRDCRRAGPVRHARAARAARGAWAAMLGRGD